MFCCNLFFIVIFICGEGNSLYGMNEDTKVAKNKLENKPLR